MLVSNLSWCGLGALVMSVLGGMQSDSLFFLWVMMELNLVGFLLLCFSGSASGEYMFKYFVIQSVGSAMFLISLLSISLSEGPLSASLGLMSLLLKLGAAPLHSWFISLMGASEWSLLLVLTYPQKFLPLMGIWGLTQSLSLLIVLAAAMASLGSLGCMSVKSLLGLSSVFSLGWVFLMASSSWLWAVFLTIYTLGVFAFITPFTVFPNFGQISGGFSSSGAVSGVALWGGLSMAGFPPTPGFLMKVQALVASMSCSLWSGVLLILVPLSVFFLNLYLSVLVNHFLTEMGGEGDRSHSLASLGPLALVSALLASLSVFQVGVSHESFWASST